MSRARLAGLAVALASLAAAAQPYEYLPFRMVNTGAQPFEYYVDSRNPSPAGLTLASVQAASDLAWASWNAVQCAFPKALGKGLTAGIVPDPPNRYDLFNVTPVWLTDPSDPDFIDVLGPGPYFALSVAVPISVGGALKSCDIYLNGTATWSTNPSTPSNATDLQAVMTHEAGHCLGLGHNGTYPGGDVMVGSINPGDPRRSLGPTDVQSLCDRYPLPGNYTAPCLADGGCNSPELKCLAQPVTSGVTTTICTKGCTTSSGGGCDIPTTCTTSTAFSPTFNGACLLPGNAVTPVGQPCANNGSCVAPNAQCLMPQQQISGTIFWEAGYCSQDCAPGQPPCPAGSECLDFGGGVSRCLQNCRVGLSDCRPGYACATVNSGRAVCLPACKANADCADTVNYECRTCDGLCVARQNPSGQIGDLCNADSNCGPGQDCVGLFGAKQCTRQCSRGCASCPTGSSCNATPAGLFCLRDCTGPGTCPSGLRCADTQTGKGCLPACSTNGDCPVGLFCYQGECYPPEEDAGCTTLCPRPDAGRPITPTTDAGTGGNTGSGGCGCQSSSPASLVLAVLSWLSLLSFRRPAWRRR